MALVIGIGILLIIVLIVTVYRSKQANNRSINLGKNKKIQEARSTIHHHQPIVSHQRQPCPFSWYLDLVFDVTIEPRSS